MSRSHIDDNFWQGLIGSQAQSLGVEHQLELLPALRARYGNLLREGIVSVAIGGVGFDPYCVTVMEMDSSTRRISLNHGLLPDHRMNDLAEPANRPSSLLVARHLMESLPENHALLGALALFTPYAQNVLERLATVEGDMEDSYDKVEAAKSVSCSFKNAASTLATYIAIEAQDALENAVVKKYKSTEASGVGHEDAQNEWQELGSILCEVDHFLREIGLGELRMQIDLALKRMSSAEQTALWFERGSAECFIDDNPTSSRSRTPYNLRDDTDSCDQINEFFFRRLAGAAVNDWERRLNVA